MKKQFILIFILFYQFSIFAKNKVNDSLQFETTSQPDSLLIKLTLKKIKFLEKKQDTLNLIQTKTKLIGIYSGRGLYSSAYDEIWQLLPLVTPPKYATQKINTLNKLITLYMIFGQYKSANKTYLRTIKLINKNINEPQQKALLLAKMYSAGGWIALVSTKDYNQAEKLAKKNIEQNKLVNDNVASINYAELQLANVYLCKKQTALAATILFDLLNKNPPPLKPIHSLLYDRLGLYYELIGNTNKAIYYLKKCIESVNIQKKHLDTKLRSLYKLSDLYYQQGKSTLAYTNLKEANLLNEQLFSSNKSWNKQLFQIKNQYEEQLKKDQSKLKIQQLSLEKSNSKIAKFKAYIFILILLISIIIIIHYLRKKAKKEILNQSLINQKQQLELQKKEELVELKNRELLSSALQLIENDNLLSNLKNQLGDIALTSQNEKIIKQIQNSLRSNKSQKWKEFEARFTSVNDNFFNSLKQQYPLLTPTDLKMCAFIKLGFSSKDIAQILGITIEGINTTRSRMRKKLNLERSQNLTEFLQSYQYHHEVSE